MKKNRLRTLACVLLAAVVLTAFAAMAAGGAGSQSDPLVTLSYLTDTFAKQILDKVDDALQERNTALEQELQEQIDAREQEILGQLSGGSGPSGDTAASYVLVTLRAGETLDCGIGGEVMLRSGSVSCSNSGSDPAAISDTTAGTLLGSGQALVVNHLYLMLEGRSVTASEDATLLVRGEYAVR